MAVPASEAVVAVLREYGLDATSVPEPVAAGTLNWNYRVSTKHGDLFVRRHRDGVSAERVEAEHAVTAFAREHGIPAPRPRIASANRTAVVYDGAAWSVYPWVDGRVLERGIISAADAHSLGDMLGRLHTAFTNHPGSAGACFGMRWDKAQTLAMLARASERARERAEPQEIQVALTEHIEMLRQTIIEPPEYFASLPCQLSHGDFHDQQVLFDSGQTVLAVTDWEMFQVTSRAWELVRCLGFARLLDSPTLVPFLQGYADHQRLEAEECRLAIQLWWQSRVGGGWVWYAYLLEGNDRVAEFIPGIVPELRFLESPVNRGRLVDALVSICA